MVILIVQCIEYRFPSNLLRVGARLLSHVREMKKMIHFVPLGKRCLQRGLLGPNQGLMMAAADDSSTAASGAELWRIIPRLGVRRKAKAGATIPGFGALDQQGLEDHPIIPVS